LSHEHSHEQLAKQDNQALRAQKKEAEADVIEARFKKAWEHADVKLTASRMGR
jgi:hypothetical protein